ncbi:MAG: hypothetical protein ACFFG0_10445 [Candidatus Thorarchaeota archaeon]
MGFVIETNIEGLGLERREESYYIYSLYEEDGINYDIFSYGDKGLCKNPTIEITKDFLKKIIEYFNEHPEELKIGESK